MRVFLHLRGQRCGFLRPFGWRRSAGFALSCAGTGSAQELPFPECGTVVLLPTGSWSGLAHLRRHSRGVCASARSPCSRTLHAPKQARGAGGAVANGEVTAGGAATEAVLGQGAGAGSGSLARLVPLRQRLPPARPVGPGFVPSSFLQPARSLLAGRGRVHGLPGT